MKQRLRSDVETNNNGRCICGLNTNINMSKICNIFNKLPCRNQLSLFLHLLHNYLLLHFGQPFHALCYRLR